MLLPNRVRRVLFLSGILLTCLYLPAQAQTYGSRFVQTTGTSTVPGGTVKITIEGFSKPDFPGGLRTLSPQHTVLVSVPVGAGSSPAATSILIRDAINASHPGTASIPAPCPDVVKIDAVIVAPSPAPLIDSDTVPGQQYAEIADPASVPTLSEWGMIILTLSILSLGAWHLYTRRRNAGGLVA